MFVQDQNAGKNDCVNIIKSLNLWFVCSQNADQKFKLVMVLEQDLNYLDNLNLIHNDKEFAKNKHKMALFAEFWSLEKRSGLNYYYGERYIFFSKKVTQGIVLWQRWPNYIIFILQDYFFGILILLL